MAGLGNLAKIQLIRDYKVRRADYNGPVNRLLRFYNSSSFPQYFVNYTALVTVNNLMIHPAAFINDYGTGV
jgi:hypothetical protein